MHRRRVNINIEINYWDLGSEQTEHLEGQIARYYFFRSIIGNRTSEIFFYLILYLFVRYTYRDDWRNHT
jgi:hypothetical protein